MTNNKQSDEPACNEVETDELLLPESHDLSEIEQELIWEIDDWAAYEVRSECRRDGCRGEYSSLKISGHPIERVEDLKAIAYQIYESYYDNPRDIPYPVIKSLVGVEDPGIQIAVADELCNAAKHGNLDGEADCKKQTKQELFDAVLSDAFWLRSLILWHDA